MDGQAGYTTMVHVIARIKGEHTIEMIKSLSEIEHTGNRIEPSKKAGKAASGLEKYIEDKEFCPQCKSHFTLVRNPKSGNSYLKCSNGKCGNTKPLYGNLVRWYIDQNDVRCPKHGCHLTLHSGQYGQYLRCEHGHTLKLTEI